MRTIFTFLAMLLGPAAAVQAHVSDSGMVQHAAEHAWLALLLVPVVAGGLRLLAKRGRR